MSDLIDTSTTNPPVAIVGIGCLFPGAQGVRQYWRLVRRGVDQVREVPDSHWAAGDYGCDTPTADDLTYCTRGAFLDPVAFDPTEFGIPPTALEATDTAQLLSLIAAKEALQDAGYGEDASFDRARVSVILGVTGALELVVPLGARLGHPIWRKALRDAGVAQPVADDVVHRISDAYVTWRESSFPGLLGNVVAGRVASRLDLHGTNCVVDAACASSLSAVHLAMMELVTGRSDMVLTGGADAFNDIFMFMCFAKTQALSRSGDARPFSAHADGTVIGEGVGVVALKRLDDAVRDGDRIYAVIRGVGTSSDGRSQSIYAPLAAGQARALRDAYTVSGVNPACVGLVEGHGTGTKVGDATEFAALHEVYRPSRDGVWCALGSVKSQIGHTKAAAGVAGLIKIALALHHKVLPPTIKVDQPHPEIDANTGPFYLNTRMRPWLKSGDHPRAAGVSAFGFGGSNFHAVLTEYDDTGAVTWDPGIVLIACSADSAEGVQASLDQWRGFLSDRPDPRAIAYRAGQSRRAFRGDHAHRVVIVTDGDGEPAGLLDEAIGASSSGTTLPARGIHVGTGTVPGKLAVVFCGQASQYPDMGRDWVCAFPEARAAIEQADALVELDGRLGSLIYPLPAFDPDESARQRAVLTRTEVAQPAIGAVCLAMWRVLQRFGVTPDMMAGHSYGELCALHAAGVFDDATLIRLSAARGRAMARETREPGTMLAITADPDAIAEMIDEQGLDVTIANRNSPTQTVISGATDAIADARRCCDDRGWSARVLDVSAAFHSRWMQPAARQFEGALGDAVLSVPSRPVVATQGGQVYPDDVSAVRNLLATQMLAPVDFVDQVRALYDAGARTFVEVGPRRVISSLIEKNLTGKAHQTWATDVARPDRCGLTQLANLLAGLAAAGYPVKIEAWDPDCRPPRQARMKVMLTGANYRTSTTGPGVAGPSCDQPSDGDPPRPCPPQASPVTAAEGQRLSRDSKRTTVTDQPQRNHTQESAAASAPDDGVQPIAPRGAPPAPPRTTARTEPVDPRMADVFETVQEGLRAMQTLQQQTATAHQRFLEGQELAHKTFERVLEGQQRLMEQLLTGAPPRVVADRPGVPIPRGPDETPTPSAMDLPPKPAPELPARRDGNGQAPPSDAGLLVVEAISAATGYPADAVDHRMDLAVDLNLDRVSRVRLLEELRRRIGAFDRIDSAAMQRFNSVSDLIAVADQPPGVASDSPHARSIAAERAPAPIAAQAASDQSRDRKGAVSDDTVPASVDKDMGTATATVAGTGSPGGDIEATLLEVVAELTGYPAAMLDADMDLEADLGIDSIKRVEILATMQQRIPQMSAVDSSYIGSLRTLRNIVDYITGAGGSAAGDKTHAAADTAPITPDRHNAQPATGRVVDSAEDGPDLQRRALRLIDLDPVGATGAVGVASGREIWITDDGCGVADALRDCWTDQGVPSRVIDPACPPDDSGSLGGLVVVAPNRSETWTPHSTATRSWVRDVFALTVGVSGAFQSAGPDGGALLAVVSRMDGRFGLTGGHRDPIQGAIAGLVKTAGIEWPGVTCRALDVAAAWDDARAVARRIAEELAAGGPVEVGLDSSCRCGLELADASPMTGDWDVGPSDVVLVTGGGRGVTAEAVIAVARRSRATMVLWGRSPEPGDEPDWLRGVDDPARVRQLILDRRFAGRSPTPGQLNDAYRRLMSARDIRRTLERLVDAGARAVYMPVDVRDRSAVEQAVARVQRDHGVVTVLIHGAGVLDDHLITDKTVEQFDRVFGAKVDGLCHVLSSVDGERLRGLVLFSSVSARFGNRGQSDYAMANEALNKIATRWAADHPRCRTRSINWGPWDGGMVTPPLAREFARRGIGLIAPAAGGRMLVAEMDESPGGDVEVVIGDGLIPSGSSGPCESVGFGGSDRTPRPPKSQPVVRRRVDVTTHPFLSDHVVGGRSVLPVAMMLEWMAHGALHDQPGLKLVRIEDFRVHRTVSFEDGGVDLTVACGDARQMGDKMAVTVEIQSTGGFDAPHARAVALLGERVADPVRWDGGDPPRGDDPRDIDTVYRDVLFHGPRLHAIESLGVAEETGIAATLRRAPAPADWMDHPLRSDWLLDPLVVDGVLQLGIVWCHDRLDAGALPSRIAAVEVFSAGEGDGLLRAVLSVTQWTSRRLTADTVIADGKDQVMMRLRGIEWTVDRSLRDAFAVSAAGAKS